MVWESTWIGHGEYMISFGSFNKETLLFRCGHGFFRSSESSFQFGISMFFRQAAV